MTTWRGHSQARYVSDRGEKEFNKEERMRTKKRTNQSFTHLFLFLLPSHSKASFPRIKQVLTVSPCTVDLGGGQKASLPYAPNDAIYDRFEDEIMVQAAEMNYCFPRRTEGEGEGRKDGGREKEDGKEKGKDVEDNYDHDDVPPQKKKEKKKKQKVTGGNEDSSEGGQGLVVSLVETKVLQENLLQIEEMVG